MSNSIRSSLGWLWRGGISQAILDFHNLPSSYDWWVFAYDLSHNGNIFIHNQKYLRFFFSPKLQLVGKAHTGFVFYLFVRLPVAAVPTGLFTSCVTWEHCSGPRSVCLMSVHLPCLFYHQTFKSKRCALENDGSVEQTELKRKQTVPLQNDEIISAGRLMLVKRCMKTRETEGGRLTERWKRDDAVFVDCLCFRIHTKLWHDTLDSGWCQCSFHKWYEFYFVKSIHLSSTLRATV